MQCLSICVLDLFVSVSVVGLIVRITVCASCTVFPCYAHHAGISYVIHADNRPSGLTPRAEFSTGGRMDTNQAMLTVDDESPFCDTRILYVMVSQHLCASASNNKL